MSAFIDISEQRRIEELSRASQERLQASARLATVGEMASLLSHELTQPLAAIASYASGSLNLLTAPAQPRGSDRAEVAMAVRRIAEQAERAGQVIRSVHDFVRRRDRTREAVAPQALLDAVLPLVRLQARKLGVRIEVALEDRPAAGAVRPHAGRAGAAQPGAQRACRRWTCPSSTSACCCCAWRACARRRCRRAPADARRWIEFSVADVGCGIGDEVAARLFTPFFTTRRRRHGPGPEPVPHGGRAARRRAGVRAATGRAAPSSASPCRRA